jgi:hypothetical protein
MKSQLKFNGIIFGFEIAKMIEQKCMDNLHDDIPMLIEKLDDVCRRSAEEMKELRFSDWRVKLKG